MSLARPFAAAVAAVILCASLAAQTQVIQPAKAEKTTETRTLPLAIYTYTQIPGGDDPALRLVIISILLALAALWVSELGARRVERMLGNRRA